MSRAHRRRILMSNRHRLSKAEAAAMRKVFAAKRPVIQMTAIPRVAFPNLYAAMEASRK